MQKVTNKRKIARRIFLYAGAVITCSTIGSVSYAAPVTQPEGATPANQKMTPDKPLLVSLQLAVSMDEPGTTLIFLLTNISDRDISTLPKGNHASYLVVTHPNGKTEKLIGFIDFLDVTTVKPGQLMIWKQDMGLKIGKYAFLEPGIYRFHWEWQEFKPRTGEDSEIYRSNEIVLMREKAVEKPPPLR